MKEVRKTYRCNPSRIAAILGFWGAIAIVVFYIAISMARQRFDLGQYFAYIQSGFWICLTIYAILGARHVISVSNQQLKITPTEIIYVYGVFGNQRIAVPISNVMACGRCKSFTQRISHTSDLFVCTIGNIDAIYLDDIEDGEEAYSLLMTMIQ